MVVALGPGKFYGSRLPRPRIYTDVKLNEERIDPPLPVLEPFLSWANDAHWSMGGLSFKRHRLQGRIEGSIKKLRAHAHEDNKPKPKPSKQQHPPAFTSLLDEPEEEEGEETYVSTSHRKKRARKLSDEFDRVGGMPEEKPSEAVSRRGGRSSKKIEFVKMETVASRTRSRRGLDKEVGTLKGKKHIKGKKSSSSSSSLF